MKVFTKIEVMFFKNIFWFFKILRKIGIKIRVSNREKEYIIATMLATKEGRDALVKAMVEPSTCNRPNYTDTEEEKAK